MIRRFLVFIIGMVLSINGFSQTKSSAEKPLANKQKLACRCQPSQSCWPNEKEWANLATQLTGRLVKPIPLIAACKTNVTSNDCRTVLNNMHNPFFLESDPSGTQSQGWLGAWNNRTSEYAVEAETTGDVVAAVNFARQHKLKLVIKGTGHDYLGRSNAPQSLLIWTHKMRQITFHSAFTPTGCPVNEKAVAAITIGAGTRWFEAFAAASQHNLYVQGGGCTTVGAAGGFTQGGGFGSFSKKFGTGAAGILQVEVVTANGDTLIANQCQNKDLFWAIRGGGGSTFGVVTKMTLKLHPLPTNFGIFQGTIRAKNDDAYKKLVQQFLTFFYQHLNNEHWGEQFSFDAKNTINILMLFQGLNENQVNDTWLPLQNWLKKYSDLYTIKTNFFLIPARDMWNYQFWAKNHPEFVTPNKITGAASGEFWWTPDTNQISTYWYTYQSWWLPRKLFAETQIKQFAETVFNASRLAHVVFHINKGLAGASEDAIKVSRETATNPVVYDAPALVIMGTGSNTVYPDVHGREPNKEEANKSIGKINQAMQLFMQIAPHSGAYANEADYFQQDWQKVFWGEHYPRLFSIKQKYDPGSVFYCHHCIGSELWTDNGMCPISTPAARTTHSAN